ncbi:hypothetical protein [Bacillus infantis]|uniref:DUF3784 domain-containing protein n=1 Tax=Bacillus infantis TaxID=324767 RepID=A0A5D4RID5_9BACI|nr:hypothetical protein [Bacillus infantis]TYS51215.1 hypothetical protein FZD51_04040 [Bacillus infantis]
MSIQLILGIYFIAIGIGEHYSTKPGFFLSKDTVQCIAKDDLPIYLRKIGKIHIVLGLLFVTMGQIEHRYNPDLLVFIMTYIVLGLSCFFLIIYLNKKYSGKYILRK